MSLKVDIIPEGFKEAEKTLNGIANGFPRAAAEAINRGLVAGRKVATQLIRSRYNLTAAAAKGAIVVKRASWGKIGGALEARGPMLPISIFKPTVRTRRVVRRGPRRQFVSVSIIKGNRKLVKGAFVIPGGKVMERRQAERFPIFPVSTIGLPFMMGQLGILTKVEEVIAKVTQERLAHNVALFTAQGKATFGPPKMLRA
jgi:Prophage minor tail protein Z (GPZ)